MRLFDWLYASARVIRLDTPSIAEFARFRRAEFNRELVRVAIYRSRDRVGEYAEVLRLHVCARYYVYYVQTCKVHRERGSPVLSPIP